MSINEFHCHAHKTLHRTFDVNANRIGGKIRQMSRCTRWKKHYLTIVLGRRRVKYVQQQKGVQAITTHIIHIYIQTRRKMYARGQEEWQRTHSKTVKQQQIWMWPILQGTQDLACEVLILTLFIVDFHLFPLLLWLLCTSLDRMVFGGKNALKWLV